MWIVSSFETLDMCLSLEIPIEVRKIVRGLGGRNLSKWGRSSTVIEGNKEE